MTKGDALVNAQSVFAWAVFFGRGDFHELTNWMNRICLEVHFPYDQFDHEREYEKYRSFVMVGANFNWENRPDLGIWVLIISWHYSD